MKIRAAIILIFLTPWPSDQTQVQAQQLEPRFLSNIPVGMSFVGVGYVHSRGHILLDAAIPIENFQSRIHASVLAYVRSFSLFGLSGRVDALIPFVSGHWSAIYQGEPATRDITGMADPSIRLSINIIGAPALTMEQFRTYRQTTIVGFSAQIVAPLGQYDPERLLNLSSNRWTFRLQAGLGHSFSRWITEVYGSVSLFTDNTDFLDGQQVDQRPLYALKAHLIRILGAGRWIAFDIGYGSGGRSFIDRIRSEAQLTAFRFGISFAYPLNAYHSLKATIASSFRIERGPDYDAVGLVYQYRWGGK